MNTPAEHPKPAAVHGQAGLPATRRRPLTVTAALISTLYLVGCAQPASPTTPTPTGPTTSATPNAIASGSTGAASRASSSTTVVTIPASVRIGDATSDLIEACLGEPVTFVGDALIVIHQTRLPNDATLLVIHANPTGAFARGTLSGTIYRLGASDTLATFVAPSGGYTGTFTANLLVIGSGAAPDFLGHLLGHVTMTPEGTVTAEIEVGGADCRSR